jgi:hypothetical protein
MTKRTLKNRTVLPVSLGEDDRRMLDMMATKEQRYLGEMVRIAICEAAKRRGIRVEQVEQSAQVEVTR